MRRAFGYAGAWLLATSVAVTVSWFGCAVVLDAASPPAPEVLSSMKVRRAGLPPPLSGGALVTGQTVGNQTPPAAEPSRATEPHTSRSSRPSPSPSPSPSPEISAQTTVRHGPPPAHTTPPGSSGPRSTQPGKPDPGAITSTFQLTGGRATVSFRPDGVHVIAAQAAPGYHWYIDQTQPDEVWVIFERPGRESELFATWDRGPSASVTEYWW